MTRMSFYQLFSVVPGGGVSPRVPVHINGVTMGPGVTFGPGVYFGGVELASLEGKDFEVEIQKGVHIVKGVF